MHAWRVRKLHVRTIDRAHGVYSAWRLRPRAVCFHSPDHDWLVRRGCYIVALGASPCCSACGKKRTAKKITAWLRWSARTRSCKSSRGSSFRLCSIEGLQWIDVIGIEVSPPVCSCLSVVDLHVSGRPGLAVPSMQRRAALPSCLSCISRSNPVWLSGPFSSYFRTSCPCRGRPLCL